MIELSADWRPVPGFDSLYAISRDGKVMRIAKGGAAQPGRILVQQPDACGYLRVGLCREGVMHTKKAHRLVVEAWAGPIQAGMTVNHKNGVKTDNRIENLEVLSQGDNVRHAFNVLKSHNRAGERNGRARLTEDSVREIRRRIADGHRLTAIAADFNVSKHAVHDIKRGRNWSHV